MALTVWAFFTAVHILLIRRIARSLCTLFGGINENGAFFVKVISKLLNAGKRAFGSMT